MGFLGSLATQASDKQTSSDPSLKTKNAAEAKLRNEIPFSDLVFSFPTTERTSVAYGGAKNKLTFPAYVTSFSDTYSPNWSSKQVFGRADPIPTYSHTNRQISFTVRIPCYDETDANTNLKKINTLVKNLYPGYKTEGGNGWFSTSGAKILNSPPLTRIKFANLISSAANPYSGLLGYITSCTPSLEIEKGVYLVGAGNNQQGLLLPRSFSITISFTPLHEHTVGWTNGAAGSNFDGGQNFPYGARNRHGEAATLAAQSIGLGIDVDEEVILGE